MMATSTLVGGGIENENVKIVVLTGTRKAYIESDDHNLIGGHQSTGAKDFIILELM